MRPWPRALQPHIVDVYETTFLSLRARRAATFLLQCRASSWPRALTHAAHLYADAGPSKGALEYRRYVKKSDRLPVGLGGSSQPGTRAEYGTTSEKTATGNEDIEAEGSTGSNALPNSRPQISLRLARKIRRQQEGTYAPRTTARVKKEMEVENEPVETLLTRLDKVGGRKPWPENPLLVSAEPAVRDETPGNSTRDNEKEQRRKPPLVATGAKPPTQSSRPRVPIGDRYSYKKGRNSTMKYIGMNAGTTKVSKPKKKELWQAQKEALEHKFGDSGWKPRKRLSPDTLEGIRALHASDPETYRSGVLSDHFKISPEAIRRILRSKWKPSEKEVEDRRARWEKRGMSKWQAMAAQGATPPAKWRAMGIGGAGGSFQRQKTPRAAPSIRWEEVVGRANA